ncbi:MAG: hypothetical protein ACR2PR_09385 [Pseudohongiellaceae bacterium]
MPAQDDNLRLLASAGIDEGQGNTKYTASVYKDKRGGFRLRLTSSTGGLSEIAFNAPEPDKEKAKDNPVPEEITAALEREEKDRQHRARSAPV